MKITSFKVTDRTMQKGLCILSGVLLVCCVFLLCRAEKYREVTQEEEVVTVKQASISDPFEYVEEEEEIQLDPVEELFEKFQVPYELRDYTRQICEIQNVDPLIFISLVQIESHWGNGKVGVTADYNNVVYYRMYGKNKEWTDLGLAQLSTRYADDFEQRHFNPSLIFSLGYVRNRFDIRDPYVNLQVGASYLAYLYKHFGDYKLAVMAYNTGMGNVARGRIPKITYEYEHAIANNWTRRQGDVELCSLN